MKINQLFIASIDDDDLIKDILSCFHLNSLKDSSSFSLKEIRDNKSLIDFTILIERLKPYYLPCKASVYLVNVTEARMITILRQILKIFGYKLVTTKKTVNKDKSIFYNIESIGFTKNKVAIKNKTSTITFD